VLLVAQFSYEIFRNFRTRYACLTVVRCLDEMVGYLAVEFILMV
jgi:hypothetical protein